MNELNEKGNVQGYGSGTVRNYGSGTWLGENLPLFTKLHQSLEILKTQQDALPCDFNPTIVLQFLRGAVNEIKRLTAENHAFRDSLIQQNFTRKGANEENGAG